MTAQERDPVVPPTHFVPEGDKPKVEATRRYFAAIFAGCRTAEECARELQRDHDALRAHAEALAAAIQRVMPTFVGGRVDDPYWKPAGDALADYRTAYPKETT